MKKLLIFLLTVTATATCALTLSACGGNNLSSPDSSKDSSATTAPPPESGTLPPAAVYHKVTYVADGVTYAIRNVKDGETAENLTIPSTSTLAFDFWTLGGEKYTFTDPVTGDLTLVAVYKQPAAHTATFLIDDEVFATCDYYDETEIEFPELPKREHFNGAWVQNANVGDRLVYSADYVLINYVLTVLDADGGFLSEIEYTSTTDAKEIAEKLPPVPYKAHYSGSWGDFTRFAENATVRPEYAPVEYTITFADANGETVGTAVYTIETDASQIAEPQVPELEGCENGRWENYEINYTDITVYPEYDKISEPVIPAPAETFTENLLFELDDRTQTYRVTGYEGNETEIKIPPTHDGIPVTVIASNAFKDSQITKVILPEGITEISAQAFFSCAVEEIELPESLQLIGKNAFANCTRLKVLNIPDGVQTIDTMAFANCTALESVYIGAGVTLISNMAFGKCANLQTVVFASRNTACHEQAFSGCPKLKITYED